MKPKSATGQASSGLTRRNLIKTVGAGATAAGAIGLAGVARPAAAAAAARNTGLAQWTGWVGTWSAAQVQPASSGQSASGFQNQTVRDIVHTSIGGSAIRMRLSNVYGTAPISVDAVYAGLRSSGAGLVPGASWPVTFAGSTSLVIPPGAELTSDPVLARLGAAQDVAVSVYASGATGPVTWHPDSRATSYLASGNEAATASGAPFTGTLTDWYLLSGIDVWNPGVAGAVVAFGPSTTNGDASTVDADHRYPDYLAQRLLALPGPGQLGVLNLGIDGNRLLVDGGTSGANAQARFVRDVLGQSGVRAVIVWEGTNDIGDDTGVLPGQPVTAGQIITGWQNLINMAHAHGITIIGATLQPDEGASYYTAAGNLIRLAVNNWMRTSGAFDGVADFSTVLEDPSNPNQLLPAYDSGDHLHPNDAGYQAIAGSIDLRLLTNPPAAGTR